MIKPNEEYNENQNLWEDDFTDEDREELELNFFLEDLKKELRPKMAN